MDVKLCVFCEFEGESRTFDLEFKQDMITIGRHSSNDVQIPDATVSVEHARILVEDDNAYLIDLGSSVGTEVDGRQIGPHTKTPLVSGMEIHIASYRLIYSKPRGELDETTAGKTSMVAMQMVREVLGSLGEGAEPPWLEVINDEEIGTRFDLTEDDKEYKIGRKECELILNHWSISRQHAMLRRSNDEVTVLDLGSKNGVTVNGATLEGSRHLKDGDVVAVGHTELRYSYPAGKLLDSLDETPTPITDLKDLSVSLDDLREPAKKPASSSATALGPRKDSDSSSFSDNLPLIIGGLLLVAAVVVAVVLFAL